jgi:1-acyl-sn-glycerol-3-phosphate acyltransferase
MAPGDESSTLGILPGAAGLPAAKPGASRFPPLYRFLRGACAPLLRSIFGLEVSGLEQVPAEGPFILASNHHNYFDAVVLGVTIPRHIHFLVMPRVYHASPLHPTLHRWLGSIPVNLERPDPGAIKRTLRVLENGGIVGIFPEGPFSREGRLEPGQPGVAMLALRSGVPVVPAAISGTYEALAGRRFYVPRNHPLAVRFGQPLHFHQTRRRRASHANREEITRRIMSHIAALLDANGPPAAQRGEAGVS